MVVHESFVTRRPLEFTLIVLFAVLVILTPWYLYLEFSDKEVKEIVMLNESFSEVIAKFSSESGLSMDDKRLLFRVEYEDNLVHWYGVMLSCQKAGNLYRVNVDHLGTGFSDVVFTTEDDCSAIREESLIEYEMRLVDWKITTFVGKEGKILEEVR